MDISKLIYTDLLKELGHLSKIDGLATMPASMGVVDMYGTPIDVAETDLPEYVTNTQRILNSTKDGAGKIVGLPIDLSDHDHKGGAGWLVGLELSETGKVIRFLIDWTEAGVSAIASNMSRYFSPTFNQEDKMILGGSLTNWPGSRDGKGKFLLQPVELSKSMNVIHKEIDMPIDTNTQEQKPSWMPDFLKELGTTLQAALTPKPPQGPGKTEPNAQTVAELMNSPEAIMEMTRRSEAMAAEKNALYARQEHVIQLAANIVSGTPSRPLGLAGIHADEIVALLMGLPMPQSLAVEKIITKLTDAMMVDFAELGTSGGFTRKPRVPAEYRGAIHEWVTAGKQLNAWFTQVMPEVGKAEDFNLTEFIKEA